MCFDFLELLSTGRNEEGKPAAATDSGSRTRINDALQLKSNDHPRMGHQSGQIACRFASDAVA